MQCESPNLEKILLNHLECPVCMEYMRPPIMQCANGHNICNICKPKMNCCPTCKEQLLNTRNKCVEDLASQVKYPCKYRANGCTDVLSYDTIVGHEAKCLYTPQDCPFAKLVDGNCSWTGGYSDMKGHLQEKHLKKCLEYMEGGIEFLGGRPHIKYPTRFIFAYNEIFFFSFKEMHNRFYFVVLYVGPAENAAKYKYKVEFVNADNTEGVTVMHLTRSADENVDGLCSSHKCGWLHYDMVYPFEDELSELGFKIEILEVGK